MLRIVCTSLLSITSQLACHVESSPTSTSGAQPLDKPYCGPGRLTLDLSSLQVLPRPDEILLVVIIFPLPQTLSTIAIQLLRLAGKVHYEEIIYCKGLVRFVLPLACTYWS